MKVCAVTCTGERPELFSLCRRWVTLQERIVDRWLVVTDNGETIRDLPVWAWHEHVQRAPADLAASPIDGPPNYALHQALLRVPKGHAAIVFEDDDWYARDHVAVTMERIEAGHMVAYGDSVVQFHPPQARWRTHRKPGASEGRVGIHPDGISTYAASLMNRPLWSGPTDGRYGAITTCGIKGIGYGLPGRKGASLCHADASNWRPDPQHRHLRQYLGSDADLYLNLLTP